VEKNNLFNADGALPQERDESILSASKR